MQRTVLFIISAFIFSACAPKLPVKDFSRFLNELKEATAKNDATAMSHLELTKENMGEIAVLKKQLSQMRMIVGAMLMQFRQLDQSTALTFTVLLKALEHRGIKLDLQKTWERMQAEEIEKKLKEKSK
jgi:hypothetical protein